MRITGAEAVAETETAAGTASADLLPPVTLSGATSEVAESKGPLKARSAPLTTHDFLRSGDSSTRYARSE